MEFFSDHWLLWTCFLIPALAAMAAEKAAGRPLWIAGPARFAAFVAACLLGMGLIHVAVDLLIP
ncbi:MAG TPA: hypothetical protein VL426_02485 [Candidatus Binatia bacterium]|jgi:hypothetical protein|nr:hypothetical protein [Candidatus Binatia bacterium]